MPYDTDTTADQLVSDFSSIIKNKVILTTGITPGGLGSAFVESVAKAQPGLLILAGRNLEKLQKEVDTITAAQQNVKVRVLKLDLSSFAAVREAAATVNSWADIPQIDVVINNAGLMGTSYQLTTDGFESQYATSHPVEYFLMQLTHELRHCFKRIHTLKSSKTNLTPLESVAYPLKISQRKNACLLCNIADLARITWVISFSPT